MAKDDVGVIFYAGHGDKSNDRLYLTAHDTDKTRLVRTSVSASQMRDLLAEHQGAGVPVPRRLPLRGDRPAPAAATRSTRT